MHVLVCLCSTARQFFQGQLSRLRVTIHSMFHHFWPVFFSTPVYLPTHVPRGGGGSQSVVYRQRCQ